MLKVDRHQQTGFPLTLILMGVTVIIVAVIWLLTSVVKLFFCLGVVVTSMKFIVDECCEVELVKT